MCTLSFIPQSEGFFVAMNRDERLTREQALLPALRRSGGVQALYPSEPSGGTWIAATNMGAVFALMNRSIFVQKARLSRGLIIPQLLEQTSFAAIERRMKTLERRDYAPFRLFAILAREQTIGEWRSDGDRFEVQRHPWEARHWYSSGLGDLAAEEHRKAAVTAAWQAPDAGSLPWLRSLHRQHNGGPGPFSICVHRADAATLSYTEVVCKADNITMRYQPGSPCREAPTTELELPLAL